MTSLDALALSPDEPRILILKSPLTGDPIYDKDGKPASILLLGSDSDVGKRHERSVTQKMLDRRGRQKTKAEELESSNVELLVKLTRGWHLVAPPADGAPHGEIIDYDFSEANARALYSNRVFAWIRDQANEFAGDRAGFLKTSAPNSSSGPSTSSI